MTRAELPTPQVGIDVSKATLDVAVGTEAAIRTVPNTLQGVAECVTRLQAAKPALIGVESTGGLERLVLEQLCAVGLPKALVNPSRPKAFAEAVGQQTKSDALDARNMAQFAAAIQPPPRLPQRILPPLGATRGAASAGAADDSPGAESRPHCSPGPARLSRGASDMAD